MAKPKGVAALIETENPNFVKVKDAIKVSDMVTDGPTKLTRREQEVIDEQMEHEKFMDATAKGLNEEGRKNLER